jgi:hypothetical protein
LGYLLRNDEWTLVSRVNYRSFKYSLQIHNISPSIEDGLAYILNHFQEPVWPRRISTKTTEGSQIVVNNKEEALARFKAANYQDCRISAYPPDADENPSAIARFQGISTATPSDIIVLIDLDRCNFKTGRALRLALFRTLQTINEKLDAAPSVIWSGRGYHIIQVINANGINLEHEKIFLELTNQPSRRFLQFAEEFLSNGKSDKSHNSIVSFRNCMPRVPGSINSKNSQTVQVKIPWNGYRPAINYLLSDFCVWLTNKKAQELRLANNAQRQAISQELQFEKMSNQNIPWIEKLLKTPIKDGRKYCIWRVLVPYLINIKHLPSEQSTNIIKDWLDKCGQLSRLGFNAIYKINDSKKRVKTYRPVHPGKLKQEYPQLYDSLVKYEVL